MQTLFLKTLFKYKKNIIQLVVKLVAGIQIVYFSTQLKITEHFCNCVSHISHT